MTLCLIHAFAPLIPLAIGVAGSIGKMIGRANANKRMRELASQMPKYQESPIAAQRLGMAQALLNARMPGAAAAEKNIYQTQANQIAAAERAATDPNQLLLAGAGATSQAEQAFGQLSQAEAADYQRRYGNLAAAQEAQIAEQQRAYEDQVRRYQMQAQIEGAQQENRQNTWGDISNLGFAGAYLGKMGMFGGIGKQPGLMQSSANMPYTSTGVSYSPSPYSNIPSDMLSMGYGQNQPYSNIPSNFLSMGYGQQQPYSYMGNNWLTRK